MKRLVYIWLVAWVLWGCQKEEAYFDVLVPADGLTFSPVEGGAVMHYRLPADEKVYSIRVRYQDGFGKDMIRTGSYACDSLLITGFNEARKGVKAYVTLCDRNDVESEALEVTFDTRVFAAPESFYAFLRKGGRVQVLHRSRLLAVTINPQSPGGLLLDSLRLQQALEESLQIPVYDVKKIEKVGKNR